MSTYGTNGIAGQLAEYETPFTDETLTDEAEPQAIQTSLYTDNLTSQFESPFIQGFENALSGKTNHPLAADYVNLIGELNDREFTSSLYNLASELEDTWTSKISDEASMGSRLVPFATQQAHQYFAPLVNHTEETLEKIRQRFTANGLKDLQETEIQQFFSELEADPSFTPAQEDFFKSIINKVKKVVSKGVDLAKKGISAVGKILPIGPILNKLKGMIRPLLDRVLKFAIGKLPANLRPYAQSLAKKFLNMETADVAAGESENYTTSDIESIQTEFDNNLGQLVFAGSETEAEEFLYEYEHSGAQLDRERNIETGGLNVPSIETARLQFINDIGNLKEGESPAPAIERFLPAAILALQPAIKIAISLIGRQRVINFLAGLLAKLVGKYVPANVAKPLASSIIDVGMSAIGFETYEQDKPTVAYEAITNTIEETVQNMGALDEHTLNDQEALTATVLEAFEKAAANNFPSQYIRKELQPSSAKGVWVMKPRKGPKQYYKKFTHIFNVTIEPPVLKSIKTFAGLPLANFLRDTMGVDTTKTVQAKVHLYEAITGTTLSHISKYDKAPGLSVPNGYVQLHPLSMCTAAMLIKEPCLGKDMSRNFTATPHRIGVGQRFCYLEISGAKLKTIYIPKKTKNDTPGATGGGKRTTPLPSDIQGLINFLKAEIRLNYFFSEEDAKTVVEKLNKNDFLGAALSIRYQLRQVLHDILLKNIGSKVKIIHEAFPELYLENYYDEPQREQFAPLAAVAGAVGKEVVTKILEKLVDKLVDVAYQAVANYFKSRAAEFKTAQSQPADGVTVKVIWVNIPGMSKIAAVLNALRGQFSAGNLLDFVLPSIPTPEVQVKAGKTFDF